MKISGKRYMVRFGDIKVTELFESDKNCGSVYMKINPILIPNMEEYGTYDAVNVETGRYNNFSEDDDVTPVNGAFHREGNING